MMFSYKERGFMNRQFTVRAMPNGKIEFSVGDRVGGARVTVPDHIVDDLVAVLTGEEESVEVWAEAFAYE